MYKKMIVCPSCKSVNRKRIRRKLKHKLVWGSKSYKCDICYCKFTWFPVINRVVRIK